MRKNRLLAIVSVILLLALLASTLTLSGCAWQFGNTPILQEEADAIAAALPADVAAEIVAKLKDINFSFLGLNLNLIPNWKVWQFFGDGATWQNWGLFLIPFVSAGSQLLGMLAAQAGNNKVVTNEFTILLVF